jgi:hypothetical protein
MSRFCLLAALTLIAAPATALQSNKISQAGSSTPGAQTASPAPQSTREIAWMKGVVQHLANSLSDPQSARFSLPFGFTPQPVTWKVWGVDTYGYFTCGAVNARNRMGGYVGETVFLAHIDVNGRVSTTLDSSKTPYLGRICSAGGLPPINPATVPAVFGQPQTASSSTLSKELADLAELHRKGALSDAEFAAAKARLLNSK